MDPVAHIDPLEMLSLWERHHGETPVRRSLALLRASASDGDRCEPESLTIRERDRELVALRRRLFGERIESCMRCPACDEDIELSFPVSDLFGTDGGTGDDATVAVDRYTVHIRLPTCGDLAKCVDLPANREDELLSACIVDATCGVRPVAAGVLPERVRRAVGERLAALDDAALIGLGADCPACEAAFVAPFDITSHLWEELAAWAAGLLDEIHTLAWAYGWSESQILALGPRRRERYIERVLQ